MGETNFTKGLLHFRRGVSGTGHGNSFLILNNKGTGPEENNYIAEVPLTFSPEGLANLHLFAAAPELYEALRVNAHHIYREAGYHKEADALEALLAKARGEG